MTTRTTGVASGTLVTAITNIETAVLAARTVGNQADVSRILQHLDEVVLLVRELKL